MSSAGESGVPEGRLEALESRAAHQERAIEELNAMVVAQWKTIDGMAKRLATLEEQVRSGSYIADPSTERPPPHY